MTNVVSRILAAASFLCGFVLLPSTSQAGEDPGSAEFVVIQAGDAQADAPVCETVSTCSFVDPTGAWQPAVVFDMSQDATVHLEADIYDTLACTVFDQTVMGDLSLPAGHDIVYINFNPPLDPGTDISLIWRFGQCGATGCSDYCIGNFPDICQ